MKLSVTFSCKMAMMNRMFLFWVLNWVPVGISTKKSCFKKMHFWEVAIPNRPGRTRFSDVGIYQIKQNGLNICTDCLGLFIQKYWEISSPINFVMMIVMNSTILFRMWRWYIKCFCIMLFYIHYIFLLFIYHTFVTLILSSCFLYLL